jgi:hypothetical protein
MSSTTSTSSGRTKAHDPSLRDIVLVDQLPSDAWAEGIVVRPSGDILATRVDGCELFHISGAVCKVLLSFPNASAVLNICPLPNTEGKEEYAVLTSWVDFLKGEYHSVVLWRISFDDDDASDSTPTVSKMADLPGAIFVLGMIPISKEVLIVVDTAAFCIWRIHIATGEVSTLVSNEPAMLPKTKDEMFGTNRVRMAGNHIYHTNTSTGVLHRTPIEFISNGSDIRVTGPPQVVASGLDFADGLVLRRDGKTAYCTNYVSGELRRIDIDAEGKGIVSVLMDDLISPTSMELVYNDDNDDTPTLYMLCCGAVYPSLLETHGPAFGYAGIDKKNLKLEVTVTTEIVVTYEPAE